MVDDAALENTDATRRLKAFYEHVPDEVTEDEIEHMMVRARHQLAVRELLGLGFVEIMRGVFIVFVDLLHRYPHGRGPVVDGQDE